MARVILMTDFSEAYARSLLLGIARYVHDNSEAWSICRLPTSLRDAYGIEYVVEYAKKIRADAIIGQFYETDDISLFKNNGIIAIAQDFKSKFTSIPNITGEYIHSGEMAATYFLEKGFKNFAFYGISEVIWSDERYEGFKNAVLKSDPTNFLSDLRPPKTDLWKYDFEEVTRWLHSLPKPVAIMACDDNQAYYITEACNLLKMKEGEEIFNIPEDIAVIGVDNDETICNLCSPTLSSISQNVEEGGYNVAKMIDRKIRVPNSENEDIIVRSTHIVTRRSSEVFVNEDSAVSKVLKLIHENISSNISVKDILAEIPMSRRLIETRFRKSMKTSLYDYIVRMRVSRMAQLLSEGKTVSESSFELGQPILRICREYLRELKE